jgi:DNA polymerase-3 subunit epsilon
MQLIDRLVFAGRCVRHEYNRRRLAARAGDDPVLRAQAAAWPTRKRLRGPWSQERFIVFDTETTGLDPESDQVVSLAAVAVVGGRIGLGDTFGRIIACETPSSRSSVVVHGLTHDKVAEGDDPAEVLTDFLVWAADATLVAHHAAFDLAMLNPITVAEYGIPIQNLVLDTAHLAQRVEREHGDRYDLDSLLDQYDIPQAGGRHTALGDALLTARLLQKLLKRLAARGLEALADLALLGDGSLRDRGQRGL